MEQQSMNERIRELAELAGYKPIGTFADELMEIYNKKFAELVIKDTIDLLKQEWYDLNNTTKVEGETPRDVGMRVGAKSQLISMIEKVKKHFGVAI